MVVMTDFHGPLKFNLPIIADLNKWNIGFGEGGTGKISQANTADIPSSVTFLESLFYRTANGFFYQKWLYQRFFVRYLIPSTFSSTCRVPVISLAVWVNGGCFLLERAPNVRKESFFCVAQ